MTTRSAMTSLGFFIPTLKFLSLNAIVLFYGSQSITHPSPFWGQGSTSLEFYNLCHTANHSKHLCINVSSCWILKVT